VTVDDLQRSLAAALMLGFIPKIIARGIKEASNLVLATAWMGMRMDTTHGWITAGVTLRCEVRPFIL
jgi:hypothetical protein